MSLTANRLLLLSLGVFFCSGSKAQFPKLWKTGKAKEINGYSILREVGAGQGTPYIYFEDRETLLTEAQQRAEVEMWTPEEKASEISALNNITGLLRLKIVRSSIEGGDTENFSVIIQDMDGQEIHRERLESSVPDGEVHQYGTFWNNHATLAIPKSVELPVRVFIIDHFQTDPKYTRTVYVVQKGERAERNRSPRVPNDRSESSFKIGDRVQWMDGTESRQGYITNLSGTRCAIEYQTSKGKTKSTVLSLSDLTPTED